MSDREELNDNNNGGMFSPQKLAQKQFRQNTLRWQLVVIIDALDLGLVR